MSNDRHVSREELMELIGGEQETPHTNRIGEHIHECTSCRDKLDELAAQSEIWNKAPELLKSDLSAEMGLGSQGFETTEFPSGSESKSNESVWSWPLESILEPPKHPEMIGRIGDYDIEREVGHGGMGIVLKAHEAELNRPLAIKVLAPHLASHGPARQRFAQEARSAAGVIHPNVIAVHRVENSGKTPYIVMPYIAGPSLQSMVEDRGPLPEDEIVRMSLQISAGLTAAHSQGLVHRDIKPANMLVADGGNRVLITDFGLARAEDDASLTRTGWLTGTPNYMSPEQTRGDRLDHRSDLFSLGSLIYFLATGRLPFRSETPLGVLKRIQEDDPTPVRQVNRKISRTVSEIIEMLLEKDPTNRFQSSAELHEVLKQQMFYLHQPDTSHPPIVKPKPVKTKIGNGSRKYLWGSMIAGGCGLLALAWAMLPPLDQAQIKSDPDQLGQETAIASSAVHSEVEGNGIVAFLDDDGSIKTVEQSNEELFEDENFVSQQDDEDDAWEAFDEALDCLEDKEFADAIELFEEAAKSEHLKAKSQYNIGCAFALSGETAKAIKQLRVAIDAGFDDYEHFLDDDDLNSLREVDEFKELIAGLKEVDESREQLWKAIELVDEGKFPEAEEGLAEIVKIDPENEQAWLNLGYAIHMQGRHDEAMKWHRKAAEGNDHRAIGHYNVACVHALQSEKDNAFDFLNSSIDEGLANALSLNHINEDPDLDSLRGDKRFAKFMKRFRLAFAKNVSSKFCLTNGNMRVSTSHFNGFSDSEDWDAKITGDWVATIDEDELDLQIVRSAGDSQWTWVYSDDIELSEFDPPVTRDSLEYSWKKKFGKIVFTGSFDGVNGEGVFKFVGSDDYRGKLAKEGIDSAPDALLFRLFFSWQDEDDLIENMKALSGLGLSNDVYGRLLVSGVEAKMVKAYEKANVDIEENADFLVWRVDPDMLNEYVAAGLKPSEHEDFLKQRVDAKFLKKFVELGLDLDEHCEFIQSRVDPEQIEEYVKANLDISKLKELVIRRVPAKLVKEYDSLGLEIEEYEDFLTSRIPVKLLKQYKDADLPLDEYEDFIRSRVSAGLLKSYRKAGFDLDEYSKYIEQRVEADLLKRYKEAGLDPLKFENAIERRMEPDEIFEIINKDRK